MTNFFPINDDTFVDFCMRDIRSIGFDKWTDTFHEHIDHLVDTNSIHENIKIINQHGGFYTAVLAHYNCYGELSYRDEKHFYAILAYSTLQEHYYSKIATLVESEIEENDNDE